MTTTDSSTRGRVLDINRFTELSDSDDHSRVMHEAAQYLPWLDSAYLEQLEDDFTTSTSSAQHKTQTECMPYLLLDDTQGFKLNSHGLPHLNRKRHAEFLAKSFEKMPAPYQAMDAARPWFFYWVFQGLTTLGQDISRYADELVRTVSPLQNATGGFAGGHGQNSHLATSYSCVLALAMVDRLEMINRKSMWQFLGELKQPDGGFKVAVMAEEDIRGAYCAMTIITLLNLPLELPTDSPARAHGKTGFLDGLGEWIGRCQTYEGGIGGAPTNEAHGAYAFCALACLSIIDAPHRSITRYLDLQALLKWIVDRQTTPEGGFAGRTNKLVDSCYSHWIGGCWALLEAAIGQPRGDALWSRTGLIRYLLTCCQQPGERGGMRDKPSARPDAYHTCYSLAGLSAATNNYTFEQKLQQFDASGRCSAAFHWQFTTPTADDLDQYCIDIDDTLRPIHPVFVIPFESVEKAAALFQHGGI